MWKKEPRAVGIDPTVDYAFKKMLGNPQYPEITLHFLNALLDPASPIREVEIIDPILGKEFEEDKLSILDIRATDQANRQLNIEVQRSKHDGLAERLAYYVSSLYTGQLGEGHDYVHLNPAIGICVLDDLLFPELGDLHLDFRLRSAKTGICLTDRLEIHLLELPKYILPSDNAAIRDPIEQWCFFFRRVKDLASEEVPRYLPAPEFTQATGILEMIARSPEEREQYEARLKLQRDEAWKLAAARREGEVEGRVEGEKRGKLLGQIEALGSILETPCENLAEQSDDALVSLLNDLQRRVSERGIG
ncbi:MAG: Rpn family recombination-promoting nuclease/putative transposase [Planctomycetota bacterium]